MPSRAVPEKGQMAHFWHIVILNPWVISSSPVAPRGVCAGQRLGPALVICRNRPSGVALWHICGTSRRIHGLFHVLQLNSARAGRSSRHRHRDRGRHLRTLTRDQSMTTHIMPRRGRLPRIWG